MNQRMKLLVIRSFAFLLDFLLVYVPSLKLLDTFTNVDLNLGSLIAAIMMVLYFVLANDTFDGRSIGKKLSKIKVVQNSGFEKNLAFDSIREASKLLYFVPYIGFAFLLISVIVYMYSGKFIHDLIGKSEVIVQI